MEAVKLVAGYKWVRVLRRVTRRQQEDAQQREIWWQRARAIARQLYQEQGIGGVGIIGSLVKDMPLNRWSQIHLVLWDVPQGAKIWQSWQIMPNDPPMNLTEAAWALPGEWQEIAERMQVPEGKGKPYGPRPQERWAFRWKAIE
ncbi:MAG: hypothetical protein AAFQ89_05720 [Cyanobacteria bacterium J06626_18]